MMHHTIEITQPLYKKITPQKGVTIVLNIEQGARFWAELRPRGKAYAEIIDPMTQLKLMEISFEQPDYKVIG